MHTDQGALRVRSKIFSGLKILKGSYLGSRSARLKAHAHRIEAHDCASAARVAQELAGATLPAPGAACTALGALLLSAHSFYGSVVAPAHRFLLGLRGRAFSLPWATPPPHRFCAPRIEFAARAFFSPPPL